MPTRMHAAGHSTSRAEAVRPRTSRRAEHVHFARFRMPDRLIERTLRSFSDDLSADSPVPGGGSAAAYAGAMGAALAAMVARISFKKEKSEELKSYIEETDNLRADFLRLVDDDSAAYARVAEAMKLPRKTDEEK